MEIKPIAYIRTDFKEKFGIPRQSGLVSSVRGDIIFQPQFRNPDALRGLEQYTHIWLIWEFSEAVRSEWSPTVRPPRLGGNKRMGVFATRSPYRPNPLGLSSVKIEEIRPDTPNGPVITVSGVDLMDKTPIYDIKPYLPYADIHVDASDGFALTRKEGALEVIVPDDIEPLIPADKRQALIEILAQDPRPQYQSSPDRVYTMSFAGMDVSFCIDDKTVTIKNIKALSHML